MATHHVEVTDAAPHADQPFLFAQCACGWTREANYRSGSDTSLALARENIADRVATHLERG